LVTERAVDALKRTRRRLGGTAGAVYVEFLIAFMPFFVFFLLLWQLSIIYTAKLMVDHAAMSAARAAGAIMGEPVSLTDATASPTQQSDMTPGRAALIKTAAELALFPLITDGTVESIALSFPSTWGGAGSAGTYPPMGAGLPRPNTIMYVQLVASVQCNIALVGPIVCSGGSPLPVTSLAAFPDQAASYQ
jgi:hypothetical protein